MTPDLSSADCARPRQYTDFLGQNNPVSIYLSFSMYVADSPASILCHFALWELSNHFLHTNSTRVRRDPSLLYSLEQVTK
jgi:hypothetical protein